MEYGFQKIGKNFYYPINSALTLSDSAEKMIQNEMA